MYKFLLIYLGSLFVVVFAVVGLSNKYFVQKSKAKRKSKGFKIYIILQTAILVISVVLWFVLFQFQFFELVGKIKLAFCVFYFARFELQSGIQNRNYSFVGLQAIRHFKYKLDNLAQQQQKIIEKISQIEILYHPKK